MKSRHTSPETSASPRRDSDSGQTLAFTLRVPSHLGQLLKGARKRRNMSQARLGLDIGLSQKRISSLEANPGKMTIEQLLRVLAVLDLEVTIASTAKPAKHASTEW